MKEEEEEFCSTRLEPLKSGHLDLPPVDREIAVEVIVRTAKWNWDKTDDHPTVIFTTQMFGSGKTFVCQNLIKIFKSDVESHGPISQCLINGPSQRIKDLPGSEQCNLSGMRYIPFSEEEVEEIANARTIFVDFRDIPLPRPGNRASLTDSLYLAILNSAIGETKTLEDYYQIFSSCPNPKLLADFLAEKTGHQGKWFIAFDEIGFIDDRNYDIFFESGSQKKKKTQTARVSLSHIDPDSRYRPFLIIAGGLSRELKKRFFVFCAGKSNEMCEYAVRISLNQVISPVTIHFLVLPPFTVRLLCFFCFVFHLNIHFKKKKKKAQTHLGNLQQFIEDPKQAFSWRNKSSSTKKDGRTCKSTSSTHWWNSTNGHLCNAKSCE